MNITTSNEMKSMVLEAAKKIASLGVTPLTQGNISLLDPKKKHVYITPHDYPYEIMTSEDISVVDLDGNIIESRLEPSAETLVHCTVYQKRPDVFAAIHTEPIYTNAFGASNREIEPVIVGMGIDVGGAVPVMPFMPSGSREFAEKMVEVMGSRNAVVWANHGLMTVGASLQKAIHCTVMVELAARIYYTALTLGTPYILSDEVIRSLTQA